MNIVRKILEINLSPKVRVIKNFFSLFVGNIIAQAFAFFSTVYLARTLGIAGFGMLGFAQGIVSYFSLFCDFGLKTIGTREIAKNRKDIKKIVENILSIRLLLALISFSLLFLFLLFVPKPIDYKILIILFGLNMFPLVFSFDWVFQGIEKMEFQAMSEAIRAFCYFVLVFLLVKNIENILFVPIFFIISYFISAIFLFYIFIKKFGWIKLVFQKENWKFFALSALPIGTSAFLMQFGVNINIILLGFLKGDIAVGGFSAANRLVAIPIGINGLFFTAVFPLMSKYHQESKEKLKKLVFGLSKIAFFLGMPLMVGGIILAPEVISFVYGSEYKLSVLPLQVLMIYLFFIFLSAPFQYLIPAANKQKYFLYSMAISAFVNLVLNLTLIPFYGATGACLALACGYFFLFILLYYYSWQKIIKVSLFRNLLGGILISLLVALFVSIRFFGIYGRIFGGLIFYVIILYFYFLLVEKKFLFKK